MKFSIVIIISFLFLSAGSLPPSGSWKLEKDKDDIKIYTRQHSESNLKEFKAITIIDGPISAVLAVLTDIEYYPEWMADIKQTKVLKKNNSKDIYYYMEAQAPWPISNRDNVTHFTVEENMATGVVTIKVVGIPDYIPEKDGIVRIPMAKGLWQLTPTDAGNKTEIVFQYAADPSGSLPGWVVNAFIVDGPHKTLKHLKEVVKMERYK